MERLDYFRQQAPEFNNLTDDAVNGWFSSALVFINPEDYPVAKRDLAVALYAAHLCWMQKYPGSGGGLRGSIAEERDDKLSRKYNSIKGSETLLGMSSYGQLFKQLINGNGVKLGIITRFGA